MYFGTQYATDCTPKKKKKQKDSWGQWDKLYTHLDGHPSNSTISTLDDRLQVDKSDSYAIPSSSNLR